MRTFILILFTALAITACQEDTIDPCEGIECRNGGTCLNGECSCPPGYTGAACEREQTPNRMRIGSIRLKDFPATDNSGGGWDLFDGADVYITIHEGDTELFESGYVENLTSAFEFTANLTIENPDATHFIRVYDYDSTSGDDFMGGLEFIPYRSNQGFPDEIDLSCSGCSVAFDLKGVLYDF